MKTRFSAAMYLRLSKEDRENTGGERAKSESESIGNQRELIRDFIRSQPDMELYDVYADDGFSGSNFERPEFQRMMHDMEEGRINCIIVKDLSRFGRDYIETGRYLQREFPAHNVRFIALTDGYDSFYADEGESGIVLPVKNFINDSYCRDISAKVKSQFAVKRRKGECIAPFVPYGYKKKETNKKRLLPDPYAAAVVRRIFAWKTEGMAVSAIADRLNEWGILSPREYRKLAGSHYHGGFSGASESLWRSSAVKRILTNEMYLGHMIQGKTEKISYKLKKVREKPSEEWVRVENTHEAIIFEEDFRIVQTLMKADSRMSPVTQKNSRFAGILFCGDCRETMIRRKSGKKRYLICSTQNRGEGCTRHRIGEEELALWIEKVLCHYLNVFWDMARLRERAREQTVSYEPAYLFREEAARMKKEKDKYHTLSRCLREDVKRLVINEEEASQMEQAFAGKEVWYGEMQKKQEAAAEKLFQNGAVSEARLRSASHREGIKEIDRRLLCMMVEKVYIYEEGRVEVVCRARLNLK